MRGTIWMWWYAPGEGTRKWALSMKGARKEEQVVDEVVFRSCEVRTFLAPGGRGVVEAKDVEVEFVVVGGRIVAKVMAYTAMTGAVVDAVETP